MSMPFSSPSQGDVLKAADVVGHLLILRPTEFLPEFQTSNGARDTVRLDVADLSVNNETGQWGAVYTNVLWFGRSLVPGLRRQIGELVLARMGQGVGKPGQSPPWQLIDAVGDPQAVSAAQQWLAMHPEFAEGHATSSQAAPAPPATPVQAPAAPVAPAPVAMAVPVYQPQQPTYLPPAVSGQPVAPVAQAGPVPPQATPPGQAVPVQPGLAPADMLAQLSPEQRAALESLGFKLS